MVKEPRWISREECQVFHEMMLLRHGGVAGVRDEAVLDAIVIRPKERFAAGVTELTQLAACYATDIAVNRPFKTGNLASALLISATFLRANRVMFRGDKLRVVESMLALGKGVECEAWFARFLWCNCVTV